MCPYVRTFLARRDNRRPDPISGKEAIDNALILLY